MNCIKVANGLDLFLDEWQEVSYCAQFIIKHIRNLVN